MSWLKNEQTNSTSASPKSQFVKLVYSKQQINCDSPAVDPYHSLAKWRRLCP